LPTVAELKERARGFEQRGDLATALKIYRHVLTHLEGTPGLAGEVPLYVKVGDLSAKLGRGDDAIEMYRRAGAHFAVGGSARSLLALWLKVYRIDPDRNDVAGRFAHDLLANGHDDAAAQVVRDAAERAGLDQTRAALAWAVDRDQDEVRAVLARLALALQQGSAAAERAAEGILAPPPAAPVEAPRHEPEPEPKDEPAEASPPSEFADPGARRMTKAEPVEPEPDDTLQLEPSEPPALWSPEELAREGPAEAPTPLEASASDGEPSPPPDGGEEDASSILEVTLSADLWREAEEQVRESTPPPREESRPPSPPTPPVYVPPSHPVHEPGMPPIDPFNLPLSTAAPGLELEPLGSVPEREPEPEPEPEPVPVVVRAPVRRRSPFGRVLVEAERRRKRGKGLAIAAAIVIVIGGGVAAVMAFDLVPIGSGRATPARPGTPVAPAVRPPVTPSGIPGDSVATPPDQTAPILAAPVPIDTATPLLIPPPVALPPVDVPVSGPPVGDATPRVPTVRVPVGSPLTEALIVVEGLEVQSVTTVPLEGRNGQRVVQRLPGGEPMVLTTAPMTGPDTVGVSEVRITVAGDTTVGSVRYWSFLVTARARAGADTVARLLRQLVRAQPRN
jgi:hypothetical protein